MIPYPLVKRINNVDRGGFQLFLLNTANRTIITIITIAAPTHTPAEKIFPIAWQELKVTDKRINAINDLIKDIVIN